MNRARVPLFGEPTPTHDVGVPLLAKGFRPFFLLAGSFAAAILPVWMAALLGVLTPSTYLDPTLWHAHEMLFGYSVAVLAGFLLTATANWTGKETLTGAPLAGLALLWVAGRLVWILPCPLGVARAVELSFLPSLALAVGRPLWLTSNRRNFVVVFALLALWLADALTLSPSSGRLGLSLGLDVVVLFVVLFAGRVFPMFTRNATAVATIRSSPRLDAMAIGAVALVAALDAALPGSRTAALTAGVAGVLVAVRALPWGARHTVGTPLLWILHLGHAFVSVGLLLRAATLVGAPMSSATHALTVGAIGCTTLGMMARVALGHSGRALVAAPATVVAFTALVAGATVRVLGPLSSRTYHTSLFVSGSLWTLAFAAFVAAYAKALGTPRPDGKPG